MQAVLSIPFFLFFALPISLISAEELLFKGVGVYQRSIITNSKNARLYFNQGLNFLYATNYEEALRSFEVAGKEDPLCLSVLWGVAQAYLQQIPNEKNPNSLLKAARLALQNGQKKGVRGKKVDKALLETLSLRFQSDSLKNFFQSGGKFENDMKQVFTKFPRDPDVGALYAQVLQKKYFEGGKSEDLGEEVEKILKGVLKRSPLHPLALRLLIELHEQSSTPSNALVAANKIRQSKYAVGYILHLPSLIYVRLGNWKEAISANERALAVEAAYEKVRPENKSYLAYLSGVYANLSYAYAMTGQGEKALLAASRLPPDSNVKKSEWNDIISTLPLQMMTQFGKWKSVLSYEPYSEENVVAQTIQHSLRGIAFAAQGKVDEAKFEQLKFASAGLLLQPKIEKSVRIKEGIAFFERMMNGTLFFAQNRVKEAVDEFVQAVNLQDKISPFPVPYLLQSARQALGTAFLNSGKYKEAAKIYREDLTRQPNNGWSLYGLSESLDRMNDFKDAQKSTAEFEKIWVDADVNLKTSYMGISSALISSGQ